MKSRLVTLTANAVALVLAIALSAGVALAEDKPLNVGGTDDNKSAVTGVGKFKGRVVKPKEISMTSDGKCVAGRKEAATRELYVWGDKFEDGTVALQNVFVYVSKGAENVKFTTPKDEVLMDQVGCMYTPHVQACMTNQPVVIKNSDNTLHNVNCQAKKNTPFNIGQPVKGMKTTKKYSKAEMAIALKCEVHAWMNAYLHVMEHPFYAITQKDGSFTLKGLPDGEYDLAVWHEFDKFTPQKATMKVTLKDGKPDKALEAWKRGLDRFPENEALIDQLEVAE